MGCGRTIAMGKKIQHALLLAIELLSAVPLTSTVICRGNMIPTQALLSCLTVLMYRRTKGLPLKHLSKTSDELTFSITVRTRYVLFQITVNNKHP
jgi:hypothetical protein